MHEERDNGDKDVSFPCQAEKMAALSRMSAALSHKISNSLTYVLNYTFILKSSVADEKNITMLQKMEQGIIKAKEVLQEVTDMSNPTTETLTDIDVKACLDEGMSALVGDLEKKGIIVEFESTGSSVIKASKRSLITALMILFENSVEAGASKIKISTVASEDSFEIIIQDNGTGIQEEHLDLIFEPFFTTKPSAAGMGLYVFYYLIQSFGGVINYRPGETGGSSFHLLFKKDFQTSYPS